MGELGRLDRPRVCLEVELAGVADALRDARGVFADGARDFVCGGFEAVFEEAVVDERELELVLQGGEVG